MLPSGTAQVFARCGSFLSNQSSWSMHGRRLPQEPSQRSRCKGPTLCPASPDKPARSGRCPPHPQAAVSSAGSRVSPRRSRAEAASPRHTDNDGKRARKRPRRAATVRHQKSLRENTAPEAEVCTTWRTTCPHHAWSAPKAPTNDCDGRCASNIRRLDLASCPDDQSD